MSKPSLHSLLSSEYKTLDTPEHKVLVEGRFLQINSSGKPVSQVWLGLTKNELIISDIENEAQISEGVEADSLSDAKESNDGDKGVGKQGPLDHAGLKLRKTLPMKFIRILVIDDRLKRMAVTTDTKSITLYEMCTPKYDWGRWKHAATKLHHKHSKHRQSEGKTAENYDGISKYVTYPFLCRQVTESAVQTEPLLDPLPLSDLSDESTTICTCMDEIHPIVVQEYVVSKERVSFCEDEEILALCKTRHHAGFLKSKSTTEVDDRNQSRIPRKSSSCPWLWKPPASVLFANDNDLFDRHYARRHLSVKELKMIQEMLHYRKRQDKAPKVSGGWDTEYTWIWDDGISEAEEDLNKLLDEAQKKIESDLLETESLTPCPECGEVQRQRVRPRQNPTGTHKEVSHIRPGDVRNFLAGDIAMQLSVRDRNLLWLLTQSNLTRLALSSAPSFIRSTECLALEKMAAWAKRVPRLVATEVLDQPSYENCLETLKLFIKVAEFCLIIRNFNSFVNVMRGLQFYSIYRLGVVWEYLEKSDPHIYQLYLALCDKMLRLTFKLYKFGPRAKCVPSEEARIPWFPALLCRLVNEVRHHQDRCGSRKYQWRPVKRKPRFKKLKGLRSAIMKLRNKKVKEGAHETSYAEEGPQGITQVKEGHRGIARVEEGPQKTTHVDEGPHVTTHLEEGSQETRQVEEGSQETRRVEEGSHKTIYVEEGFQRTTQVEENSQEITNIEESHREITPVEELPLYDSGSSSCESADEAVDDIDAQAFEALERDVSHSEEMESNKSTFDKIKEKVVNVVKVGSDDDDETMLGAVQHRVTEILPETLRPEPAKPRKLTLLEKLSGKTEPEFEPPTTVVDKVKELILEKEEEEHKPYEHEVIDDDLSKLLDTLEKEEKDAPNNHVHIVANKKRTPKIVRFFGQFLWKDSKSAKSIGGIRHEPTRAEMALMSFPSPADLDLAKRRYSMDQKGMQLTHALKTQMEPRNKAKSNTLLASSAAFAKANSKFKDLNTNTNAKKMSRKISILWPPRKSRRRSANFCPVCFSTTCPYYGEPGRLLLEVQLSAARYKYIHNPKADAFLMRRPVLSNYLLLESFRQGLA